MHALRLVGLVLISLSLAGCNCGDPNVGLDGDGGLRSDGGAGGGTGTGGGTGAGGGSATGAGTGGGSGGGGPTAEVCDGADNDQNGIIDDVDVAGDGVCDCLKIATLGYAGQWGSGSVFSTWLNG
ncbi:MAG TPA: hypothetical protein VGD87_09910, partial [Archangium sp.]